MLAERNELFCDNCKLMEICSYKEQMKLLRNQAEEKGRLIENKIFRIRVSCAYFERKEKG